MDLGKQPARGDAADLSSSLTVSLLVARSADLAGWWCCGGAAAAAETYQTFLPLDMARLLLFLLFVRICQLASRAAIASCRSVIRGHLGELLPPVQSS